MCENVVGTPKSLSNVPKKRRLAETSQSSDEIKTRKVESPTDKCDVNMTVNKLEELCTQGDEELAGKYAQLKISVKAQEEKLRKLKLVQTYRTRDKIENLDELTEKWLKICQCAITDLYEKLATDPKPTLTQLINHLKIDHKLIDYNSDEEDFPQ